MFGKTSISLMSAAVLLAGCDGASTGTPPKPSAPPVEVSAAEISKAFQANEAKAKITYEGKTLIVTGMVKDIDLSLGDAPVIRLRGSGEVYGAGINSEGKMTDVDIHGPTKEQAAEFVKGKPLTFSCTGIDEVMGSAQLNDCTVQAAPAVPAKKK